MKILFLLIQEFNPIKGGVERSTYKIGSYLAQCGHEICVYSLDFYTKYENINFTVYKSPYKGNLKNSKNIDDLRHVLKRECPDIIINQSSYYLNSQILDAVKNIDAIYLACLRQSLFMFKDNYELQIAKIRPTIISSLLKLKPLKYLMLKRHHKRQKSILKHILDVHDRYIMLTPSNVRELKYFIGDYKKDKVITISNSIPKIPKLDFSSKEKVIVHVGRLNKVQKRSDLLIPLWEKLSKQLLDWKFIIVGDGPLLSQMKAISKGLERIEFVGYKDPTEYYKIARAFVMPSAYEGFPNTLIEAQSYGCFPFVFDSYSALRDIVNDENAGICDPYDLSKMASQIEEIARDETMAFNRFELVRENAKKYTISNVGRKWERLLTEFI